ncbi:MAG TPA: hypothetical protein VD908_01675 [Cytophagales bacterium]|nr:hypothetical protein [Cytophagales bacterium]
MAANKKHPLPPDFNNPFENRDPNEVWEDLKKNAKPVSREEVFKNFKSKSEKKK